MTATDSSPPGTVREESESSDSSSRAPALQGGAPAPEAADTAGEVEDEDLAGLPGPRRHLNLLEADLRSGSSCVWYFPDPVVETGRADFFVGELTHRMEGVISVPGAGSLADRGAGPIPPVRVLPEPRVPLTTANGTGDAGPPDDSYGDLVSSLVMTSGAGLPDASPTPAPASASTLEDRLAKELGVTGDPVAALAEQAAVGLVPPTIVVRCWNESTCEEAARLLRVAVATFHEAGLPGRKRPRFLFAARAGDLPRGVLGDRSRWSVHWWWKVWTRLDTEVLMAWRSDVGAEKAADALLRRVTDAVVAEVCGPDIDRALALRVAWSGGDLDSLRTALTLLLPDDEQATAACEPGIRMSTAHAWSPDPEIHDAWADGSIDSWDGRIRLVHGRHLLNSRPHELRVLVCHAQNRVLLPLIEEARTSLIHHLPELLRKGSHSLQDFCARARSQYRNGTSDGAPDPHELEIGGLSAAAYMLNLTTAQRHRLRLLHLARNALSHRNPLGHKDLVALAKVLTTDWTAK